ncbi:hypothetical protein OROMI_016242 [Orobanche minor]
MEIDILTDFQEQNPNSLVPSASELAFDLVIVSERIRSLPESEKETANINTEVHRRSARCFHFSHHLEISGVRFHLIQEPTPEIAMKNPGVLGCLRLGKKQTSRAPAVPLEPVPEVKPLTVPIVEPSEEPEELLLNTHKRRRSMEPSVPASSGRPIAAVPISEHPLLPEELSAPSAATAVARAKTSRGRPFLATRRRSLGFAVPISTARRWYWISWRMINLDEVARHRSPDAAQVLFTLALQTATMVVQVVRDSEERPFTAHLQADLEAARKRNAELVDKLAALEKNSTEAVKEVKRMKAELVEARRSGEVALKEATDRERAANQKATVAEGKLHGRLKSWPPSCGARWSDSRAHGFEEGDRGSQTGVFNFSQKYAEGRGRGRGDRMCDQYRTAGDSIGIDIATILQQGAAR